MSIVDLLTLPCVIARRDYNAGGTDIYGNPLPTEATVETTCELQQRQRSEDTDRGEITATSWLLVLPAGTEVGTGDAVIVDGEIYELDGEPWRARNPRSGLVSHIECTVVRTTSTMDEASS